MRRDQVEAQSYLTARLASALVRADPDAIESPTRRDSRGLIMSILAGAVAVAVVIVINLLAPQNSLAWRKPGQLIVDKGTGSRYLLVNGQLRPVQNLTSARLLVGSNLAISSVSSATLRKVPRGAPIGVPGEPDTLAQAALLNVGSWQVCAVPAAAPMAGLPGVQVVVRVGAAPAMSIGDSALLVSSGSAEAVVWHGHRYALGASWVADVLGFAAVTPAPVPASWLALLPNGGALAPVPVPSAGKAGPKLGGRATSVGQLFSAGSGSQVTHYLMLTDGLVPLTPLQYLLNTANRATAVHPLSPFELAHLPRSRTRPAVATGWPTTTPQVLGQPAEQLACLQYGGTSGANGVASTAYDVVFVAPPTSAHAVAAGDGPPMAAQVTPGGGALVADRKPTQQSFSDVALVSDAGEVFPIPSSDALQALGYSLDQVTVVPDALRAFLPEGVPLAKQS